VQLNFSLTFRQRRVPRPHRLRPPDSGSIGIFLLIEKTDINIHKIKHSNERPFKCCFEGCFKDFKTENALKCHSLTHSIVPSFKCHFNGCNSVFKTKVYLKKHVLHMHTNQMPIQSCDWPGCEYTTRRVESMKSHKSTHSDKLNFICDWPECGKRFFERRMPRFRLLTDFNKIHMVGYLCLVVKLFEEFQSE